MLWRMIVDACALTTSKPLSSLSPSSSPSSTSSSSQSPLSSSRHIIPHADRLYSRPSNMPMRSIGFRSVLQCALRNSPPLINCLEESALERIWSNYKVLHNLLYKFLISQFANRTRSSRGESRSTSQNPKSSSTWPGSNLGLAPDLGQSRRTSTIWIRVGLHSGYGQG